MLFDTKKAVRVIGPQFMSKTKSEEYPEGLSEGHIEAFLQLVKDNKYDVYVAEADENATIRNETFMQMIDLIKAGAQIPPKLLIDYMNIPNSEEVKRAIDEYTAQQLAAAQSAKGAPGA
jgi:topoisomerase IA-like protein